MSVVTVALARSAPLLAHVPLTRIGSAFALAIPALLCVYVGFPAFDTLVALAAVVLAWEWSRLCLHSHRPLALAVMAAILLAAIAATMGGSLTLGFSLLLAGAIAIFVGFSGNTWLAGGVLYLGSACILLIWLRMDPDAGQGLIFWLFSLVWATDSGAYAVGRLVGGPKLAPSISPRKTWSGVAGGLLFGSGVATTLAVVLGLMEIERALLVSMVISFVAQIGDLAESRIKREFGVKDTSGLIPGHGGLLDRVDGLIAATITAGLLLCAGPGVLLSC